MQMDQKLNTDTGGNSPSLRNVPWQIWVVVALLGLEGMSNLLTIPKAPIAAFWLLGKCLFIVGLLKAWKWIFVVFLIIGSLHALFFISQAPGVGLLNLVLVILVASALRFYFPRQSEVTDQRHSEPHCQQNGRMGQ